MKIFIVSVLFALASPSLAGTPVSVNELPAPVTKTIQEYFPASKTISAKKEIDDGKREKYEVMIQYKDITMEVEVSSGGKIVDLDM